MYKIEIYPIINESILPLYYGSIDNNKLFGTIEDIFNGEYIKLNDVTHNIKEIIVEKDKMSAIIEFTDSKLGNHARVITNSINLENIHLKPYFINETNLGLNLKSKNKLRGVVL